jgi:hypothetical protein
MEGTEVTETLTNGETESTETKRRDLDGSGGALLARPPDGRAQE